MIMREQAIQPQHSKRNEGCKPVFMALYVWREASLASGTKPLIASGMK